MPKSPAKSKSTLRQAKLYEDIFDKLGGKCAECNWTDRRALLIFDTRRERTRGGLGYLYGVLKNSTERYRLLCANHLTVAANSGRRRAGKINR